MTKIWGLALGILLSATGCTFQRASKVSLTVLVPPSSAPHRHRGESSATDCVFVNVLNSAQAARAASSSTACWEPTNFSGLVWRGGSSEPISVPMQIAPGKGQVVQVLAVVGTNVNSATCHGMPEAFASQNSVYQYGVTTADLFAGAEVEVPYSPRIDQAVLSEGCGASGGLQTIYLKPGTPLVTKNGQRQFRAIGTFSDGTSHELTSVSWTSSAPAVASVSATGIVSGISLGNFTITASQGNINSGPIAGTVTGPNMYLADNNNGLVRRISAIDGFIHLLAGVALDFTYNASDNGLPGNTVPIGKPMGIVTDRLGNVYLSDNFHGVVRRVDAETGIITAYAGDGIPTFGGDGGSATSAHLNSPQGLAINSSGDLFIADTSNNRVRIVYGPTHALAGKIDTFESITAPGQLVADSTGALYVSSPSANTVYKIPPGGGSHVNIVGFAARICGSLPNGSPTTYGLIGPSGLALDEATSRLFISEQSQHRILVYDFSGAPFVGRFAGSATCVGGGWTDGSLIATMINPVGIAYYNGDVYFYDTGSARIARIDSGLTVHTFAGDGSAGYNGDDQAAVGAELSLASQIWLGE